MGFDWFLRDRIWWLVFAIDCRPRTCVKIRSAVDRRAIDRRTSAFLAHIPMHNNQKNENNNVSLVALEALGVGRMADEENAEEGWVVMGQRGRRRGGS